MGLAYHLLRSRPELEEVSRRHATGVYYGEHRVSVTIVAERLLWS